MARYIQRFASPYSAQKVVSTVSAYLTSENFDCVELNGEKVWKKGHGVMTAPQYVKLTLLNDGTYLLEAWIKLALLPGVYVGEMGIKGFLGAVPKGFLKARIEMIFRYLNAQMLETGQNNNNANSTQAPQYQQPQYQQPQYQQPQYQQPQYQQPQYQQPQYQQPQYQQPQYQQPQYQQPQYQQAAPNTQNQQQNNNQQ